MDAERKYPVSVWFVVACALYVLLRGLILHVAFDEVSIPIFELPGVGMIPKVALDGWKGSSPRMYYDNCGGLISTGILAIPFYALLGASYLSLKLVPAALGLGALVLLWRYLDRNWSRPAADAAALLFAVAPPTLTRFSLIAQGNHFENLFFQLAVLTAFGAVQSRPERRARLFGFGLACGFAIFTYLGSLAIVVLTCGLHLVLRGPRRALRDLGLFLPGFLLGIAPLVWVALADSSPQASLKGLLFAKQNRTIPPLERLVDFSLRRLPRAGSFRALGPIPAGIGEGLYLAAFLGSWLCLLPGVVMALLRTLRSWGRDRGDAAVHEGFARLRHAPYVLYFPTIVVVITLSNLRFSTYIGPVELGSYRYLVPHFMYAAMVIGTATTWLLRSGSGARRVLGGVLAAATLAALPFAVPVADWNPPSRSRGASYRGYWMPYYSGVALHHQRFDTDTSTYTFDYDEVLGIIADFPPHQREEILLGIGFHIAMALDQSPGYPGAPRAEDLVAPFPEADAVSLARGLGSYLGKSLHARPRRQERAARNLEQTLEAGGELLPHVLAGLSLPNAFPLTATLENRFLRARSAGRWITPQQAPAWMTGRGMSVGRLAGREQPGDDPLLEAELATPQYAGSGAFWRGVGAGIGTQAAPASAARILARWVPAEQRANALLGLGQELRRYYRGTLDGQGWADEHLASGAERAAFRAGWGD